MTSTPLHLGSRGLYGNPNNRNESPRNDNFHGIGRLGSNLSRFPDNSDRDRLPRSARGIRNAATGVHRGARERGGVAARGPGTTDGNAGDRFANDYLSRSKPGPAGRISRRSEQNRLCRNAQRGDRVSVGGGPIRAVASPGGRAGAPSCQRD